MAWDDEEQDEEQDDDVEEAGDEQGEQEEPELDDATRAIVARERQKAHDEAIAQVRTAAQKRGLAWTGEDLAVADFNQFTQGFGQIAAGAQPPQPAQQPADGSEEEMPDPSYDAPAFAQWMRKHDERVMQRTVEALKPEFESLRSQFQARDQVGDALERAREVLADLGLSHIIEHEDFERIYRAGLIRELRPEQWSDPRALAALAGAITPDLKERGGFQKRQQRAPDESGRYGRDEQRRALDEYGPSRSTGRGLRPTDMSPAERRLVSAARNIFGMDAEEFAAAADETGEALRSLRERRARAGGR